MSPEHSNIALDDQLLDGVHGGFTLLNPLANVGQAAGTGFQKGETIGSALGAVGAHIAATGGAMLGALNGLKNEVGKGVNEAVGGRKDFLR